MKTYQLLMLFTTSILFTGCNSEDLSKNKTQTEKSSIVVEKIVEPNSSMNSQQSLKNIYAKAAMILFKHRAVSASLFGIPEDQAGYHYAASLEDYSTESESRFRKQMQDLSQQLQQLQFAAKDSDAENISVMIDISNYYAGAKNSSVGFIDSWMGHSAFILNQINGPMIDIPNNLVNSHVINNAADANDYLLRLKQFDHLANSILDKASKDESAGWIPPRVIIDKTYSYLHGFTQTPVKQMALITSFKQRLDKVDNISALEKKAFVDNAEKLVAEVVFPAFKKLAKYTETLSDKGRTESGIWAQPGGNEFYQYSLKRLGDTDLTAEQIHQLGVEEVQRISKQMDIILKAEGYSKGSVGERMVALNQEDRFLYPNNDQGRAELLAALNLMIDEISLRMPDYFESVPPYKVEVKRIPVATQDTSAGGYYTPPTMDGTVPGIYWINLKNTAANAKFDLKTLTYHEAIPGHHWQVALNLAQQELPLLRRIAPYNAYVEGWALYSERVAAEMGLYKNDPFSDLGRLKAELFRAVRLVVDTGLHQKKWSREQAIEYMANTTGSEIGDVTSEIERYMAWPGQALGYKLGMLKILELRELAKNELAENFELKKFHDVILLGGAVPMTVLQNKIEHWIAETKASLEVKYTN